jgi:transposase
MSVYIYMDDHHGCIFITRHEDEEWDEDCIVPTFTQSSVCVMVWGCIFRGQKGLLIVLEYPGGKRGGMTVKCYQEQVLEGVLLDFWEEMKVMKGDIVFQQDNAAAHQARSMKDWLRDHGITLLFHPPNSPDLNPTEHIWHELKHHLRNLSRHPTTIEELKEAVKRVWNEIPIDDINKYIDRIPDIVQAMKKGYGGHTEY